MIQYYTRMRFPESLAAHPIIAAVRDLSLIRVAIESPVKVVFLMTGDALSVGDAIRDLQRSGKTVIVHIDLVKGMAADKEAVQFIAKTSPPDGIVSTKLQILQATRKAGLSAVQQLFLIDTQAFQTGVRHVSEFRPDAIEVMPGLMPRVIRDVHAVADAPIIAAGLIKSYGEVREALDAGAVSAVVGAHELWGLDLR